VQERQGRKERRREGGRVKVDEGKGRGEKAIRQTGRQAGWRRVVI
jgi:hypothetical protein